MTDQTLPFVEPDALTAGTSAQWLVNAQTYLPADGWALTYYFVASSASFNVAAADNDDGNFLVSVAPAVTEFLAPDLYYYQALVTNDVDTWQLRAGRMTLNPAFSAYLAGYDNRSYVKRVLDAINALLEGRASADVDSYTINGRSLTKMRVPELLALRSRFQTEYQAELNAEKVARGDFAGNRVRTRFNAMSRPAGFGRSGFGS